MSNCEVVATEIFNKSDIRILYEMLTDITTRLRTLEYDIEKLLAARHMLDYSKCSNPHCDKCWAQNEANK